MKKIIKEQQRISKHKIEEWQPPHLTLQKSKGVFKQPHFQSAGDLIRTVIYCVCTFSAPLPFLLLFFFFSIVTFLLAYNKRNLMTEPYMQISFSLQCVLGKGGMIGEIHRGESHLLQKLLYCKVILVFQAKGTSSHRKLCQLRLFESAIFFACCWGQWSLWICGCLYPAQHFCFQGSPVAALVC